MEEVDRAELERRLRINEEDGLESRDLATGEIIALIASVIAVVLLALMWRLT